jgi:GH25 family lysozyme M1 (1,4-beta-N-acetylmuramidase)
VPLWLIDHSHHEPDLNWRQVRAEGYVAVVHKATEGTNFLDSTYARRIAAIRAAGLIPGAYHWLHSSDPVGQCRFFLDTIGSPTGMLIQLDWEDVADPAPVAVARTWIAEWRAQTGDHPVLIYLPHWFWADHLGSPAALDDLGPLWGSHYVTGAQPDASAAEAKVPAAWRAGYAGWRGPTVLQTTDNGRAAGITGLDLNTFYGTYNDLIALTGAADMTPDQSAKLDAIARQMYHLYTGSMDDEDNVAPRWWRRIVTGAYDTSEVGDDGVGLETIAAQIKAVAADVAAIKAAGPPASGGNLSEADVDRVARRVIELTAHQYAKA